MTSQSTARIFEYNELIRFYGQVVSTEGIDDNTKKECNEIIRSLLSSVKSELKTVTANAAGLVTNV